MRIKIYYTFLIIMVLIQCNTKTLNTNEIALDLAKLENNGLITQSDKKDDFFRFLQEIYQKFEDYGYGHRITEMNSTWNLYEDDDYLIMTGSVAKSDYDVYMFTILFLDKGEGVFEIVYEEVGDLRIGSYPKYIIPYEY
jgi:hypothetical protein